MRIGIAQINSTVADFAGNRAKILDAWRRARNAGADLVVTPELAICGYPPLDLLERPDFVAAAERSLATLASEIDTPSLVVGGIRRRDGAPPLANSAFWIERGAVRGIQDKRLLPTYDVFDEARYFSPGERNEVWEIAGRRVGIAICEDLWDPEGRLYSIDPAEELRAAGVDLVLSPSASPFHRGKRSFRRELFVEQARRIGAPVVLANLVGGNTELVFDGTSLWADPSGIRHELISFRETVEVIGEDDPPTASSGPSEVDEAVADALVLGIRDYFGKSGIESAWIGLSGGIDSALVAGLAVAALGPDRVHGVVMPSRYSSPESAEDAGAVADALGMNFSVIPIEPAHAGLATAILKGIGEDPSGLADENLQARIRGTILMTLSNSRGGAVLATGNKSEIGVGYCTLYGDLCGALAPLGDVSKLGVYRLARLPRFAGTIPARSLDRPPSAELRPGQLDTDTLPPYDAIDPIIKGWVEEALGFAELVAAGHDPEVVRWVIDRIEGSEYKRVQTSPIIRVTPKAFGLGRRVPIARRPSEI